MKSILPFLGLAGLFNPGRHFGFSFNVPARPSGVTLPDHSARLKRERKGIEAKPKKAGVRSVSMGYRIPHEVCKMPSGTVYTSERGAIRRVSPKSGGKRIRSARQQIRAIRRGALIARVNASLLPK